MYVIHKTYTDYDGTQRTEDFYFNLSKAELVNMEYSHDGGIGSKIERIVSASDTKQIMALFEDILLKAYGEKSDDGRHFRKSDEISEQFKNSAAYSEIYMDLLSDSKAAADFVNNILPKDLAEQVGKVTTTPVLEEKNMQ